MARADAHVRVANALHTTIENEWAAVCYFYSAYHLLRGALRADPVFDDLQRLQRIHRELIPQDRHTARHKGRKHGVRGREWGMTDLALLFYDQPVAAAYDKLHRVSCDVRYEQGLDTPLDRVLEWYQVVRTASDTGALVCRK